MKPTLAAATALVLTLAAGVAAKPKFLSVWKTPAATEVTLAGKKLAALVISNDNDLRVSGEEALVRELERRGLQGVATYRIAPKEELTSGDKAKMSGASGAKGSTRGGASRQSRYVPNPTPPRKRRKRNSSSGRQSWPPPVKSTRRYRPW